MIPYQAQVSLILSDLTIMTQGMGLTCHFLMELSLENDTRSVPLESGFPPERKTGSLMIIMGSQDNLDAGLAFQKLSDFFGIGIGASGFGVDQTGAEVNNIRF
jgi:hypothetical protein